MIGGMMVVPNVAQSQNLLIKMILTTPLFCGSCKKTLDKIEPKKSKRFGLSTEMKLERSGPTEIEGLEGGD